MRTNKNAGVYSGPRRLSRRRFLLKSAAAVSVPCFVPGSALGLSSNTAANERINVGAIGVGVHGLHALQVMLPLPDNQVVAVCDPRAPRREAAVRTAESHYAQQANQGGYKGCAAYNDFRELLARADIDAVLVCTPDHWHGVIVTRAAEAGKDIYGEKPIARSIRESIVLRDAVRRYGRIFQTGTQQRSDSVFRHACMLARNGYIGRIQNIRVGVPGGLQYPAEPCVPIPPGFDYDLWSGPAPLIPFDNKRCEWLAMYMISHYCAGFICNWGVHHLDIAQWGCPEVTTEPFELDGQATFPQGGMTDTCIAWNLEFKYASGLRVNFVNVNEVPTGWGCRFNGDQGWVHVSRQGGIWAEPRSLLDVRFCPGDVQLHRSPQLNTNHADPYSPYTNHAADFLRSVRTRVDPASPIDSGFRATTLGNVADIMARLGRKVKWDWKAEQFVDDPDANAMLSRSMRSPWTL